jgi:glucose dehydrogenase
LLLHPAQRRVFFPLTQINADTIGDLVPAWSFSFGGEKQRGQESQPLVYNGKMFVTGSYSRIFALDVKTGRSCGSTSIACRTASCRAATWSTAAPRCSATW